MKDITGTLYWISALARHDFRVGSRESMERTLNELFPGIDSHLIDIAFDDAEARHPERFSWSKLS